MSNPINILHRLFMDTKPHDRLYPKSENGIQDFESEEILNTNIYNIMLNRGLKGNLKVRTLKDGS
jgi:hypothetical protein